MNSLILNPKFLMHTDTTTATTGCPADQPRSNSPCKGSLSCKYGEYVCCGEVIHTVFADCKFGEWMIAMADLAPCPCKPEGLKIPMYIL